MSVDPHEDAHHPAWWGVQVEQLRLVHATTMMLHQTGIHQCQDFQNWSAAELGAWAAENAVNVAPVLRILAIEGIRLAPDDRPDRLVRLVLAPASDAGRQAAIDYYGLLGRQPCSLQATGADGPSQQRLLERRVAEARPRINTLKRLAPQLAVALHQALANGDAQPGQLALSIVPLLGEGQTAPLHFARLLLDVIHPRREATTGGAEPRAVRNSRDYTRPTGSVLVSQDASSAPTASPANHVKALPMLMAAKETASPDWTTAAIEYLSLPPLTTTRLKRAGILQCRDLTSWTGEQLHFWAADNGVTIAPLMRALTAHAIPLESSDQPDRLVRLLLAPLEDSEREAVTNYWGLLDRVSNSSATHEADPAKSTLLTARIHLKMLTHLPPPVDQLMVMAIAHRQEPPERLASAITPLLGTGDTVPLHFARLLQDMVHPPTLFKSVPVSTIQVPTTHEPATVREREINSKGAPVYGQRAERTRAATDLIDLLFNEDEA